jgi:hypothetical protein
VFFIPGSVTGLTFSGLRFPVLSRNRVAHPSRIHCDKERVHVKLWNRDFLIGPKVYQAGKSTLRKIHCAFAANGPAGHLLLSRRLCFNSISVKCIDPLTARSERVVPLWYTSICPTGSFQHWKTLGQERPLIHRWRKNRVGVEKASLSGESLGVSSAVRIF